MVVGTSKLKVHVATERKQNFWRRFVTCISTDCSRRPLQDPSSEQPSEENNKKKITISNNNDVITRIFLAT